MRQKGKKPATCYYGFRNERGTHVYADSRPLPLRLDIWQHCGVFDWGDNSPGDAQLAVAILGDALVDKRKARALHQAFKVEIVSKLDFHHWTLTSHDVQDIVKTLK